MKFLELAEKILEEEKRALTVNEIWLLATEKGYAEELESKGKTPWATLSAMLYVNIRDNPKSQFVASNTRPKKFYLKSHLTQSYLLETLTANEIPTTPEKHFKFFEKDLHPFLTYYAYHYLNCYTKTINHSQSSKKEFGEWVHPDIVGCYFLLDNWKSEVYELSTAIGNTSIKLLSFELKRKLSFGNLRESFFQAVSNSSWANEGYLVAVEISDGQDFRDELARLSTSFGIGVIKLNLNNPDLSEVIFPAKFRETLDWETINKLTMNSDFKEFIATVKIDITSNRIHEKEYNQILDAEKLKLKLDG